MWSWCCLAAKIPKQSAVKRTLFNCKATNLEDLKEVFSRVSWDIVDFDGHSGKICFSQLFIKWFQL